MGWVHNIRVAFRKLAKRPLFSVTAIVCLALGTTRQMAVGPIVRRESLRPTTLLVVYVVLVTVSLAACYVPALRASRTDPVAALRDD